MSARRLLGVPSALVLLAACPAPPAGAAAVSPGPGSPAAQLKALLRSRELWATVDVCSPADQPDVVGIRGSMPGDRNAGDRMYMAFRLQYMDAATNKWVDLSSGKAPAYVYVGPGGSVRQGGRSFQLVPRSGKPAVTMRGVVTYQWRRGGKVLQSVSRPTTARHKSRAGADPAGYSAATCTIG